MEHQLSGYMVPGPEGRVYFPELLNSTVFSDVVFLVNQQRFYSHKQILCLASPYFNNLLKATYSEFGSLELEIEIRDYSADVFFLVLKFIYTGKLGLTNDRLDENLCLSLIDAAVFYELRNLQHLIEFHIAGRILNPVNVCRLWKVALETGSQILSAKCADLFRTRFSEVHQSPELISALLNPKPFNQQPAPQYGWVSDQSSAQSPPPLNPEVSMSVPTQSSTNASSQSTKKRPPPKQTQSKKKTKTTPASGQRDHSVPVHGAIWSRAIEKMDVLLELLRDMSSADLATVFLYNPSTNELISNATHPEPVEICIPSTLGIAGHSFTEKVTVVTPNASTDPRFFSGVDAKTKSNTLALVAIPLCYPDSNSCLGVLEILNKTRETPFSEDEVENAKRVAELVVIVIHNANTELDKYAKKKEAKRQHANQQRQAKQMESKVKMEGNQRPMNRPVPVIHFKDAGKES